MSQGLSAQLKDAFAAYQTSLKIRGKNGFGTLTADNYATYLLKSYLVPAANTYLRALTEEQRAAYLARNPWLHRPAPEPRSASRTTSRTSAG